MIHIRSTNLSYDLKKAFKKRSLLGMGKSVAKALDILIINVIITTVVILREQDYNH